jgi:eukaryotic-like serine/threonine-protein kinase
MNLSMIGTTLGHYRVLDKLGEGGMGEVYAAEDLTLHRQVALKVLSPQFSADAERRQRFAREAQAVAALNHPNIVTIHSVEQAGDVHFLTMERVAGKPLSELIPPGGLPLARLLKLAIPLTDAVSAAHQRGITHRDLKPANIMIGDDGRLKVLDFGLAKLKEDPVTGSAATILPTQSVTGEGRILGTIAYMSPEQAEGRPVDHRSDIFSLGIVLYEMTTGERPFKGETSLSVLSSIIKDTPRPITDINRALPRDLARVIRRCLMKDPEDRYQSGRDIRNDLEELRQSIESGDIAPPVAVAGPVAVRRGSPMAFIVVAIPAAAAVIAAALWIGREPRRTADAPTVGTFTQLTQQRGIEEFPSLSSDGRWMVYASNAAGNFDIYLQSVGGQTPINLTPDIKDDDTQPVFSPDGERIAFRSERDGGGIFVMARTGESVKRLTDAGYNPAWAPTSREIAFGTENIVTLPDGRGPRSGLWIVDVDSGSKRQLATDDAVQPSWSPHGSRIAYWAARGAQRQRDILTLAAGGGDPVLVTDDAALDWNPVWSADGGHLYFSSNRGGSMNLWRVAIDEVSGRVLQPPEAITVPSRFAAHFSASGDGRRLAFTSVDFDLNVQRVAFDPATEKVQGEAQWVTTGSKMWLGVDVTRDGSRIVLTSRSPQEDVFVARADGGGLRQLTSDAAFDRYPRWSPDGARIAFYSNRGGGWDVWTINPDGSSLTQITKNAGAHYPIWSPNGARMAFTEIVEHRRVAVFDVRKPWESQTPEWFGPPPAGEGWRASSWSADGKALAGVATRSAEPVGVVVYTLEGRVFKQLTDTGGEPFWLNDNQRLLFTRTPGTLAVIDARSSQVRDIWSRPGEYLVLSSVSGDGRQLFFMRRAKESDIWMAVLK